MEVFDWSGALTKLERLLCEELKEKIATQDPHALAVMEQVSEITRTWGKITPNIYIDPKDAISLLQAAFASGLEKGAFVTSVTALVVDNGPDQYLELLDVFSGPADGPCQIRLRECLPEWVTPEDFFMNLMGCVMGNGLLGRFDCSNPEEFLGACEEHLGIRVEVIPPKQKVED